MLMCSLSRRAALAWWLWAGLAVQPVSAAEPAWATTWAAAPDLAGPELKPQTIRQVLRTSAGGSAVRVRLSNLFGTTPLTIGPVHLALHAAGAAVQPGTDRRLSFGGQPTVTIAPGASVRSDAVPMTVAPLQDLALSLYLPQGSGASTVHSNGLQTVYLVEGGDTTAAPTLPAGTTDDSRYFVTDVEVAAGASARTLVVLGDSLTDGIGSTPDHPARWSDALAERLQADPALASIGVANKGIAGNRILRDGTDPFIGPSTLARLERDVLSQPGLGWVLLLQGVNDITASDMLPAPQEQASAEQIIDGMRAVIARAHAGGAQVWGGTLMPRTGAEGRWAQTPTAEAKRQAVNRWIRGSKAFDAVVDFDLAVRDPAQPDRLRPDFDSGDHTHPNDAGYRAMAAAVDLGLLKH
ncbi:SGNH/GDSL hydrolase family protein [Ideonella sp.]|uniref:SGNH/GDSL hydrolase family protein n=1 Tax=Ideonella sp. TaxID=1929293 RepID=UPI0035B362F8